MNVDGLGFASGAPTITLHTLSISGFSPAAVSATSLTSVNITGNGFDAVDCDNNRISVAGVYVGVLGCGLGYVTVLYPGASF